MRLIDIAAASSFALLSLAVIIAMNPDLPRGQAQLDAADSSAASALLSYLRGHDLRFLSTADAGALCNSLTNRDNASEMIRLSLNGVPCQSPRESLYYPGHFEFELVLPGRSIKLEALAR